MLKYQVPNLYNNNDIGRQQFKEMVSIKNNDQWHINKLKEEKANKRFKELADNININERSDINNSWAIIKSTMKEAA